MADYRDTANNNQDIIDLFFLNIIRICDFH